MNHLSIILAFLFSFNVVSAQNDFESFYPENWEYVNNWEATVEALPKFNIMDFGADSTGNLPSDEALIAALTSLNGSAGIVYFSEGTFLFKNSINLPSGVVLKGASANSTKLFFNLNGSGNLIEAIGKVKPIENIVVENILAHSNSIRVNSLNGIQVGDYLKVGILKAKTTSDWAKGTVAQILEVKSIDTLNNSIYFEFKFRHGFKLDEQIYLSVIEPVKHIGIECLGIERLDPTKSQTSNIFFKNAVECWVKNIASTKTNFAHINVYSSSKILVEGSYFTDAFSFGNGGKAYGVMLQFSSGECLVQNNFFEKLRHSMILQAGANGNVFAYNYSIKPFWDEVSLPSNSAGDLVLHGNYVYANLFESNVVQNIVIDDSHGINGPHNTFFKNEAQLYGIFMNNNPATDSVAFIGNKVNNTQFLKGLYYLNGKGHFEAYNNIKGSIVPANSKPLKQFSLYQKNEATFLVDWSEKDEQESIIPAQRRYLDGVEYTASCTELVFTSNASIDKIALEIYPNPAQNKICIKGVYGAEIQVFNMSGEMILQDRIHANSAISIQDLKSGIYLVKIKDNETSHTQKLVVKR